MLGSGVMVVAQMDKFPDLMSLMVSCINRTLKNNYIFEE